jgi:N-acyl-D-aspartate/D-glutamate deacylase
MLDVKIAGGTVIDGTGSPGRIADLRIRDGRIAEVWMICTAPADASSFWD